MIQDICNYDIYRVGVRWRQKPNVARHHDRDFIESVKHHEGMDKSRVKA